VKTRSAKKPPSSVSGTHLDHVMRSSAVNALRSFAELENNAAATFFTGMDDDITVAFLFAIETLRLHTKVTTYISMAGSWNNKLLKAAQAGDTYILQEAIQAGADLQATNEIGHTALMCAAHKNYADVAAALLRGGANVDAENKYRHTALMLAAWKGHSDVITVLLEAGVNVNAKDKYGYAALQWAAATGLPSILPMLIDAGARVNAMNDKGHTALTKAIENGHTSIIPILLGCGSNWDSHA
jgi:ankyrin repeat protein